VVLGAMHVCLKCGSRVLVNAEGIAPVLCDHCVGRAQIAGSAQTNWVSRIGQRAAIGLFILCTCLPSGFVFIKTLLALQPLYSLPAWASDQTREWKCSVCGRQATRTTRFVPEDPKPGTSGSVLIPAHTLYCDIHTPQFASNLDDAFTVAVPFFFGGLMLCAFIMLGMSRLRSR
jgi:DNA-directed RNA polymerase subunit RPC12/RpoP